MNSLYASLSLILAEVILFLLVVCGALIFLKVKEKRKDKKALLQLTEKIKEGEEDRLNVLSIKLKETHDLDSDALNAAAKEIHNIEIALYITMMNIYAERDSEALKKLEKNIAALTESSAKLGTITVENSSPATTEVNNEELNKLKNENSRLQHELTTSQQINERLEKELDTSKKEMRETVAEFISAFSGGRDAAEEKLAEKEKNNEVSQAAQQADTPALSDENPIAIDEASANIEKTATAGEPPGASDKALELAGNNETASPTMDEPEAAEEDNNPFLSIDEKTIANNDDKSSDNTVDHAMGESDLDTDLGLDINPSSQPPEDNAKAETVETSDTPAVDDIDALLTANADSPPAAVPEVKGADENFEPDDIDSLLAANTATDKKTAASATDKESDISADDIDAILEDIDLTTASVVPSDNKEVEKAS